VSTMSNSWWTKKSKRRIEVNIAEVMGHSRPNQV
jgi:hypothetical protein